LASKYLSSMIITKHIRITKYQLLNLKAEEKVLLNVKKIES